jgi:hypothetical protein
MMDSSRDRRLRGAGLLLAGVVVALVLCAAFQQINVSGQAESAELSGVLADLARAVPQEQAVAGERAAAAGTLELESLPKSVQDAMHSRRLRINAESEVQVYVLLEEVTDENLQVLESAGVAIEISDVARHRVQARIPVTRLQAVARLPFVDFVRPPTYAIRHAGSVLTEGDAILHADAVRQQMSLDGAGVRVGVVSDGLKGVFATGCTTCGGVPGGPIATGDLPAATGTRSASGVLTASSGGITGRSFQANGDLEGLPAARPPCAFPGAGAEGTALLEIIRDLAPGAQLSFANADTDMAFNQAVNYLAAANDVVMDDLGFYGDAYDGTSPVSSNTAAALNNPSNRIRAYVTSVGNAADEHYFGAYVDSGVDGTTFGGLTTPGDLHLFEQTGDTTDVLGLGPRPYNVILLPQNGEVVIFLSWDDPFGASTNNYDLFLVRESTGAVVASSTDPQTGRQDPVEALDYVNTGAAGYFRIVVQNVRNGAQPRSLNLYSFQPQCASDGPRLLAAGRHERHNYNTASRSVAAQSDAGGSPVSVISVGAICSASAAASGVFAGSSAPDESCLDLSNSTIEFFSSRGPTLDGRLKPDISAIDGVSITGAGGFGSLFFGTSAATPHVAGIAALLLQGAPCLRGGADGSVAADGARTTLRNLIIGNAAALGDVIPNDTFGYGRADALASAQRTLPVFKGLSALTVSGNTALGARIAASDLGFLDPSQCPLTTLNWTGGCSTAPDAIMTCPFGTTRVSVSASNNGRAFSPASNVQITVTNFGLSVAPPSATLVSGQSATFQVVLTAQDGPFTGAVTLGCTNLPQQTSCTFNPPVLNPGGSSARSTLTLSTTSRLPAPTARRLSSASVGPVIRGVSARPLAWLAIALFLAGAAVAASRRRRALAACGSLVTLALLAAQVACGTSGRSSTPKPPPSPAPTVALAPASLVFTGQAVQTTSAPQTVTLTNTGGANLAISSISTSGDFSQNNTCGASIGAGASCAILVTFAPTATGPRVGTLTISDNAANSPQTISLTGTGLTSGTPPGTYQIGVVGTSGTLVHSGTVTLVVQ